MSVARENSQEYLRMIASNQYPPSTLSLLSFDYATIFIPYSFHNLSNYIPTTHNAPTTENLSVEGMKIQYLSVLPSRSDLSAADTAERKFSTLSWFVGGERCQRGGPFVGRTSGQKGSPLEICAKREWMRAWETAKWPRTRIVVLTCDRSG